MKTGYTLGIIEREQVGTTYEDLKDVISGKANCRYTDEGNESEGFGWAGQEIGFINNIPTVQELFDELILHRKRIKSYG